jgi:hypothetical protein
MMLYFASQLKADAEARRAKRQAERDEKGRAEAEAARERLTPLDERLARLLASIPREVQAEGLSLPTVQGQLRARGRGHSRCHAGELGEALRRAGFVRERRWRGDAEGFCALWIRNEQLCERKDTGRKRT